MFIQELCLQDFNCNHFNTLIFYFTFSIYMLNVISSTYKLICASTSDLLWGCFFLSLPPKLFYHLLSSFFLSFFFEVVVWNSFYLQFRMYDLFYINSPINSFFFLLIFHDVCYIIFYNKFYQGMLEKLRVHIEKTNETHTPYKIDELFIYYQI